MGAAYHAVLQELRLVDRQDAGTLMVAKHIVELARTGPSSTHGRAPHRVLTGASDALAASSPKHGRGYRPLGLCRVRKSESAAAIRWRSNQYGKVAEPRDSATCEGPLWLGYGATQATFRAGAKPTGTTATSFIDATSTTDTLFVCELAT